MFHYEKSCVCYTSGHVAVKAGHWNIGPANCASFSPCHLSAVGCDAMLLSGGDAGSAWSPRHLNRMHQHPKVSYESAPVLFLFPCAFPSCEGINFRCEIRRKSVPSFIIKTWLQESWPVFLALGVSSQILAIHMFSLKKTPPKKAVQFFNYLERFYHDWKLWGVTSKIASVSCR